MERAPPSCPEKALFGDFLRRYGVGKRIIKD
jgi:hypothetical protein